MRGKISVKTDSSSSNNNNTNNKRAGTDSVYENVEFKRLQETAKTSTQAAAEVNEEVVNSDDTSDDDTKTTKLPPIIGMFKFLRAEKSFNIYECCVSDCKQEIKAHNDTESQRRKHLGSKTHNMTEYLYPSQRKSNEKKTLQLVSTERKREIDKALADCVIEDVLPFGTFQKAGMLKVLNLLVPGYIPQTRQTVSKRIAKKYKEYIKILINFLKQIEHLALTTDMWKNKHLTHFLGITLHFFDDDFNYVSLVIGFRKFVARHLAVNLKQFIKRKLTKLQILDKIIATTADNGCDIVKAISNDFGVRFSCF